MLYRVSTSHVTVFAPAKLNLFLKVLEKRADGYHELETLMVSVGLYDTLVLTDPSATVRSTSGDAAPQTSSSPLHLTCRDGGALAGRSCGQLRELSRELPSAGPDNLVLRAARLLHEYTGTTRTARIELV